MNLDFNLETRPSSRNRELSFPDSSIMSHEKMINSYLLICILLSAFLLLSYPTFDYILVGILSISIRGEAITESIFWLDPTFTQLSLFKIPLIGGAIDPFDKLVIHRLKIPLCFRIWVQVLYGLVIIDLPGWNGIFEFCLILFS